MSIEQVFSRDILGNRAMILELILLLLAKGLITEEEATHVIEQTKKYDGREGEAE